MLYYLLYQVIFQQYGRNSESYIFKGLNVIQYVTFRTAWATITALLISLLFGGKVIRKLAALKVGQEIREELSHEHQAKKGTPTMGGVLILGSVFLSTILWARIDSLYLWLALGATTAFGVIGFWDDYIKIVKKKKSRFNRQTKTSGTTDNCADRLGLSLLVCKLSLEFEHPVFQGNRAQQYHERRSVSLSVFYNFCSFRFVKRG